MQRILQNFKQPPILLNILNHHLRTIPIVPTKAMPHKFLYISLLQWLYLYHSSKIGQIACSHCFWSSRNNYTISSRYFKIGFDHFEYLIDHSSLLPWIILAEMGDFIEAVKKESDFGSICYSQNLTYLTHKLLLNIQVRMVTSKS